MSDEAPPGAEVWVIWRSWSVVAVCSSEERLWATLPDDFTCAPSGSMLVGSHRDRGVLIQKVTLDGPLEDMWRLAEDPPPDPDQPSPDEVRSLKQMVINAGCTDIPRLLRAAKWLPVPRYAQNAYWRARLLYAQEHDEPVYLTRQDDSEVRSLTGTFSMSAERVFEHPAVEDEAQAAIQRAALDEQYQPAPKPS